MDFLPPDQCADGSPLAARPQGDRAATATAHTPADKPFTVDALRGAIAAIRAGRFDVPATRAAALTPSARPARSPVWHDHVDGRLVVAVVGGHAGAGASTVALALSEALTDRASVELEDWNPPHRSGLAAAVSQELGIASGWRQGRRGPVLIWRQAEPDVDYPPAARNGSSPRVRVVHLGHLTDDLRALSSAPGTVVVVTRVSVPGVRQTEHVLSRLARPALVVGIGPRRWPGTVKGSCGPRLRELRECQRVIAMPIDPGLAVTGLTTDSLPRQVATAGRRLAGLLQQPSAAMQPRHAAAPTSRAEAS